MLQFTQRTKTSHPNCQISYLSYDIEQDNSVTKREYTQKKRELKLDAIIDGVKYDESELPTFREDDVPIMGIKLYQKNISLNLYSAVNPEQHKFVTWIQELESIALRTKQQAMSVASRTFDLNANTDKSLESVESFSKKVVTRMVMCGNYIAVNGRIGPGNVAYIGTNALEHLLCSNSFMSNLNMKTTPSDRRYLGQFNNFDCVVCREIDPDTIIIFRSPITGSHDATLMLVEADWDENRWAVADCSNSGVYAMSFTIK